MKKAVFIDAGHGGKDPGCPLYLGEKKYNLRVAQCLASMLRERGYVVGMSRGDDRSLSLEQRCQMANAFYQANGGIFVSIHHNASDNPKAEGAEVYHAKNSRWGSVLAKNIGTGVRTYMYEHIAPYRGEKTGSYYVLVHTQAPAVLVECEFMTSYNFRCIAQGPLPVQSTAQWINHASKVILQGIELTMNEK